MANIEIEISGRRYRVGCADGEEEQLRSVAAIVDGRARDASHVLGNLTETGQLLYAALLLADDVREARKGSGSKEEPASRNRGGNGHDTGDPEIAAALEGLADRVERLAARLDGGSASNPPLQQGPGDPR